MNYLEWFHSTPIMRTKWTKILSLQRLNYLDYFRSLKYLLKKKKKNFFLNDHK